MAKRTKKNPNKTASTARKKKPARPVAPAARDGRGMTEALTDAQRAQVWALREENLSLRQIGARVGCSAQTVSRELHADPGRLGALVTAQKEERARLWQQIEHQDLAMIRQALEDLKSSLWTATGKPKPIKDDSPTARRIAVLTRLLTPLRMVGDSATAKTQLLTGNPTEITHATTTGLDLASMSDEQIIDMAIDNGIEDMLPPALAEKLAARRADG